MNVKIRKWALKHRDLAYPERTDVVSGNFSIAQYFADADASERGIHRGYFAIFENITVADLFYGNVEFPVDDEWLDIVSKIGDLDEEKYSNEMYLLLKDFRLRVLAGEDMDTVDKEISRKMEEVATRNNDGSHNMKMYEEDKKLCKEIR